MDRLKTLDLFSGVGGISKALKPYARTVAYCENDAHAQAVLLSRMETHDLDKAPIWDDIRTLSAAELVKEGILTRREGGYDGIDLIAGGFPCQNISRAGRGEGLSGEQSGLFFQIARLAEEIRPKFIFLENVSAIRTRGLDVVVGELSRLGYDCRWDTFSAQSVGAPHRRERWFLLGLLASDTDGVLLRSQLGRGCGSGDGETTLQPGPHGEAQPVAGGILSVPRGANFWSTQPGIHRVADGVPMRVDRAKRLGNSVVPQCVREAFERLAGIKR